MMLRTPPQHDNEHTRQGQETSFQRVCAVVTLAAKENAAAGQQTQGISAFTQTPNQSHSPKPY